jgi:hypothetical protein
MNFADQHKTGTHFWLKPWVYDFLGLGACQVFVFQILKVSVAAGLAAVYQTVGLIYSGRIKYQSFCSFLPTYVDPFGLVGQLACISASPWFNCFVFFLFFLLDMRTDILSYLVLGICSMVM